MHARERRQLGAHYTGERDALKLVRGLFLDELEAALAEALTAGEAALRGFLAQLRRLRIFDPACGCGDFLVLVYRELRGLERRALVAVGGSVGERVGLDQVFGIEIAAAAVEIAEAELRRVDAACGSESGAGPRLIVGDALEVEWSQLLAPGDDVVVLGNPPFVGKHYQTARQKAQMRAVFAETGNAGDLDYVACWFVLAARYLQGTRGRCAFVATNSMTQGEQVPLLWRALGGRYAVKIHFAHRSFRWTSAASGAARVHVVIVGFGAFDRGGKRLFEEGGEDAEPLCVEVANISPYLTSGPDRCVVKATKVLAAGVPEMRCGSKPSDGGALVFSDAEREAFLCGEPGAEGLFRRYCGSEELIHGGMRWCLWLRGVDPAVIGGLPRVAERVERVRAFRAASTAAPTRGAASRAAEFFHVAQPPGDYIAVPEVSSQRRRYIPVGVVPGSVIASNKLYVVPTDMFVLGVLASAMHMAWVQVVGGRLKSDYQYSATMVFNTFPWPVEARAGERAAVEAAARGVLAARVGCPGRTLAELYDPRAMPGSLARAHAELDAAVDRCFRAEAFVGDADRFEHALTRYQALALRAGRGSGVRR